MRNAVAYLLTLGLVLLTCAATRAQGTAELTYTEVDRANHPLVREAIRSAYARKGLPPQAKGMPEDLSDNVYYLQWALGRGALTAVFDAGGTAPRLFVDTDADGDLADEKPIGVRISQNQIGFAATLVQLPGRPKGETVRIGLFGSSDARTFAYLQLVPGGYVHGTVELGGQKHKVAVIDANLDGRYDGFVSAEALRDARAHDQIAFRPAAGHDGATEIAPLTPTVHVGGVYYTAQLAPDGLRIEFAKTDPKLGTLDVQCPDLQLTLQSAMGRRTLRCGGSWPLPEGTYVLKDMSLQRKEENGSSWSLMGYAWQAGNLAQFTIRAGETTTIPAGPPLTLDTSVDWGDDTASANLTVVGRAGEHYSAGVYGVGRQQPPPTLKVVDRAGKTLASGTFAYG
ncbi:MAG: hypothetical protein JW889_03070 [Verrucomicrobia bacterium]|nr:hypothetical protein [Verrucomicrobiota bacterium]